MFLVGGGNFFREICFFSLHETSHRKVRANNLIKPERIPFNFNKSVPYQLTSELMAA